MSDDIRVISVGSPTGKEECCNPEDEKELTSPPNCVGSGRKPPTSAASFRKQKRRVNSCPLRMSGDAGGEGDEDHLCHGGWPIHDGVGDPVDSLENIYSMWCEVTNGTTARRSSVFLHRTESQLKNYHVYSIAMYLTLFVCCATPFMIYLIWNVHFEYDSLVYTTVPIVLNLASLFSADFLSFNKQYSIVEFCAKFTPHFCGLSRAQWYANQHSTKRSLFQKLSLLALGNVALLINVPRTDNERRSMSTIVVCVFMLLIVGVTLYTNRVRVLFEFFVCELVQQGDHAFHEAGFPIHPAAAPLEPHVTFNDGCHICWNPEYRLLTEDEIEERRKVRVAEKLKVV